MKNKKLFMPLALIFFGLFFASNLVKAQNVDIRMVANPAFGSAPWVTPSDQNWEIDFYDVNTLQTYYVYANPSNFNYNGSNDQTWALAFLPNGTYQVTFYYINQYGESGDIYHNINIDMGTPNANDMCATSTYHGYVWPAPVILDNTVASTVTIYTYKDF